MKVMRIIKKQYIIKIIILDFSNLNKNSKWHTKQLFNIKNTTPLTINSNITKINLIIILIWKEIINTFNLMKNKIMKRDLIKTIMIIYITLKNMIKGTISSTNLLKLKINTNHQVNFKTKEKNIKFRFKLLKKK